MKASTCSFDSWYNYFIQYEPEFIGLNYQSDTLHCHFCGARQEDYYTFSYDWMEANIDLFSQYAENIVHGMLDKTFVPKRRRMSVPSNSHLKVGIVTDPSYIARFIASTWCPFRPCPVEHS